MTEIEAGPALDALVARVVFGESWVKHPYCTINGHREDIETWMVDGHGFGPDNAPAGYTWGVQPPRYSSEIDRAWSVIDRMRNLGYSIKIDDRSITMGIPFWKVTMHGSDRIGYGLASKPTLAICGAALHALREKA